MKKSAVTRLRASDHSKAEFKSFPTVYDMLIFSNIRVSYTNGKLLSSVLQWKYRHLHTSDVVSPGVPGNVHNWTLSMLRIK